MQESPENKDDSATKDNGVVTANVQEVPQKAEEASLGAYAKSLQEKNHKDHNRTPGLRLFDIFLYPILTNFSVFAISVTATYLTSRGGDRNAEGKLIYGKIGEFFQKRGDWLVGKFKGVGMSHEQADMSKMVFFSFLDGSMMAPLVKMLEDRRERIGRWIDDRLGTMPDDPIVYKEEPKQTWLSVLSGRLATVAIVVPTAVALDKTGLNDKLFTQPGIQLGETLAKKPRIAQWLGKLDIKELSKISLFEFFYTSVCTTGLYFSSRFFARKAEGEPHHNAANTAPADSNQISGQISGQKTDPATAKTETPKAAAPQPLSVPAVTDDLPARSFVERYHAEGAEKPLAL